MDELKAELASLLRQLNQLSAQQDALRERVVELEGQIYALLRDGADAIYLDYCRREDADMEDFA